MANFLYISEVFCPWCYGFSPVMQRIVKEYPLDIEVLCGALNEEPVSLEIRAERMPNIAQFIERMFSMTGVRISSAYLNMLFGENNHTIFMDSQKAGLLFYALKCFIPHKDLQIMEELQDIFYGQGLDIFSHESLRQICQKYAIHWDEVDAFMKQGENIQKAMDETEESFVILDDVVLYPTLFYVDDDSEKHFISRGFMPYDELKKKLDACITHVPYLETDQTNISSAMSCSLDGVCSIVENDNISSLRN